MLVGLCSKNEHPLAFTMQKAKKAPEQDERKSRTALTASYSFNKGVLECGIFCRGDLIIVIAKMWT